jgi:hypothetical protein
MTSAERHQAAVGLLVLWTTPPELAAGLLAGRRPLERMWRMLRMLPAEPLDGLRTATVEQRRVRQGRPARQAQTRLRRGPQQRRLPVDFRPAPAWCW